MKRVIITACLFMICSVSTAGDWPGFLGPDRNGVSYDTVVDAFPDTGAKFLWRKDLGDGYGAAAIVGDEVFVIDREDSLRDVLRCLSLTDGKEKWSASYESPGKFSYNGSRSTPAVGKKCVYTMGPMGQLTAFSRETHKILWQKNIVKEFDAKMPRWVVSQSPLIYKDMIIVAPQGNKASLAAYELVTGKLRWTSVPVGGGMNYCSPMQAEICGKQQIVAVCGNGDGTSVVGVDPANGKIVWKHKDWTCRAPIPGPTLLPGDRLFLTGGYGADSAIIQIEKTGDSFTTGTLQTIRDTGSQIANPLVIDGFIFINCNTNKKKTGLACLNETGEMMWNTGTVGPASFDRGNMVAVGDKFFILDSAGYLRMILPDPYRYEEVSCVKIFESGKNAWAPMAVSKGMMVLRNHTQMACIAISPKAYEQ